MEWISCIVRDLGTSYFQTWNVCWAAFVLENIIWSCRDSPLAIHNIQEAANQSESGVRAHGNLNHLQRKSIKQSSKLNFWESTFNVVREPLQAYSHPRAWEGSSASTTPFAAPASNTCCTCSCKMMWIVEIDNFSKSQVTLKSEECATNLQALQASCCRKGAIVIHWSKRARWTHAIVPIYLQVLSMIYLHLTSNKFSNLRIGNNSHLPYTSCPWWACSWPEIENQIAIGKNRLFRTISQT